ncbi:Stk1 family PASTA domain-containing Ser/Thr kinase [Bacillaceae bacterium SIJ1]|uniref:Stk1 family PASTA domain-containing Ser/Thr kinase n=1 Tax=Litoribacterium kuwaitense TaxID=1398745 RepID=UPI0013EB1A94|nr:Stk1 family PASTA domain-containing Ser/Thr kinase [Litoribacterium kuwaitense]NGP45048.1 Stk1 family PASTA domain-containing Ser/Thr kinase [Litoribacterium kuwaitense]
MIGSHLDGRYQILDYIGGGGMANVYLAKDMILDREVAVKVLKPEFSKDEEFISRFRREARSATSLSHPNIVDIYDVGEQDDTYYIVMEYVSGQTLKQFIQKHGSLSQRLTVQIMEQLTSAISHAHDNHIIHRDIKPHNILIDEYNDVKVTDFGIAVAISSTTITQTNSLLGSVHYLSPEQARGSMSTKKSDIYSLGVVMYEMLRGQAPFSGESPVGVALKHLQNEIPSLHQWVPHLPQSVENVILKACAKDPLHRYDTVDAMHEDLTTVLDEARKDELKFVPPDTDDEKTKAVPVISSHLVNNASADITHNRNTSVPSPERDKEPPQAEEAAPQRKRWPKVLLWTLVLVLGIGTAAVAAATFLPTLMFPEDVAVPDVDEMPRIDAQLALQEKKFNVKVDEAHHDEVEEGLVIRSIPNGGETAKEGSTVTIEVSLGKEASVLSDYIEKTGSEAQRELELKGYNVKMYEIESDEPKGIVVEQYPEAGSQVVPEDTTVTLEVSRGPQLFLESLIGKTKEEVQNYASEHGLKLDVHREAEYSEEVAAGEVLSQSPPEGTTMEEGDPVAVVLSKGPPPVTGTKTVRVEYEPEVNTFEDRPEEPGPPFGDRPGNGNQREEQPKEAIVRVYVNDMEHQLNEAILEQAITETTDIPFDVTLGYKESAEYRVTLDDEVVENGTITYEELKNN